MENQNMYSTTSYSHYSLRHGKLSSISSSIIFSPPNPLLQRTVIPFKNPKFGLDLEYVPLPLFNEGDGDKLYDFEIKKQDPVQVTEKDINLELYINSSKMLSKLVYAKLGMDELGKVSIDNIVDLKAKKKKKRYDTNVIPTNENDINIEDNNIDDLKLAFESRFENGNLQLVYKTEPNKYQLFLSNDTNTTGYSQWFFFKVSKTKQGKTVNFSIMNYIRSRTKYHYGMKMWVYSSKENANKKVGWVHTELDVSNYRNFLYRLVKGQRKFYATVSFDYKFKYDDDEVYFANCIPFTYSDLQRDLNEYQKHENTKYPFFIRKTLCSTIAGNDVDYIIINKGVSSSPQNNSSLNKLEFNNKYNKLNNSTTSSNTNISTPSHGSRMGATSNTPNNRTNMNVQIDNKEGIIMFARQHPSESVGSWVIKGAIEFLLGDSIEANYLRDNFIFKIIPMMNPDGVIAGNTRTSYAGCDLNRRWVNPDEMLHPEIYNAKELILGFSNQRKINCILDFHGHFGAFGSFFYANREKEDFSKCKLFPYICSKGSKIIDFGRSRFSMPRYKKGTGRIDLYRELCVENVYTLETSNFGCITGEYENKYFTVKLLMQIGIDICLGIVKHHYIVNNKMGIQTLRGYPELKSKISEESNVIQKDFDTYCEETSLKYYVNNTAKKKENGNNNNNNNDDDSFDKDKEKNEDDEENDDKDGYENDSDSESEPSLDNMDEEEIKKLIPISKKDKKKLKKLNNKTNKKMHNIHTKRFFGLNKEKEQESVQSALTKTQNALPALKNPPSNRVNVTNIEQNNKNNNKNNLKEFLPLSLTMKPKPANNLPNNNDKLDKTKDKNDEPKENALAKKVNEKDIKLIQGIAIIKVNSGTQTEDIYFKMHWSCFIGSCLILSAKIENYNRQAKIGDDKNFKSIIPKKIKKKVDPSNTLVFDYNNTKYLNKPSNRKVSVQGFNLYNKDNMSLGFLQMSNTRMAMPMISNNMNGNNGYGFNKSKDRPSGRYTINANALPTDISRYGTNKISINKAGNNNLIKSYGILGTNF